MQIQILTLINLEHGKEVVLSLKLEATSTLEGQSVTL